MNDTLVKVLEDLEKRANLEKERKIDVKRNERMLAITRDTGQFFNILLHSKKAKNMLEVGTSVGYSTIWCAEAIKQNSGKIITIEKEDNKVNRAKENFSNAGVDDTIEIKQGIAIDILKSLNEKSQFESFFDFVLLDADKENTLNYFELVLPMTKIGGLIVIDNMLYPEKYQKEMDKVRQKIQTNSNVRAVLVPIGNGEEVITKLN